MIKHPLATTLSGMPVYVDLINSPASNTIAQQPHISKLISEVLAAIKPKGKSPVIEFDFGRTIGTCDVVATTDKDIVMYAKPLKQDAFFRFVRRRHPEQTQYLTISLRQDSNNEYELYDVWMGRDLPAAPGSERETAESKPFWNTHAWVLDSHPVQHKTLTTTQPY
ncbi:MAG TPA: hypothetical protein VLA92_03515 [Candidatus Saccharimonadales bacterium]|nr:hypothetical protein [Candidatus Saccharimonadales bacterium]